ncbi:MAG: hypothetical protein WA705_28345 [Candidatus Ozemobacteraceae bacterium]
MKKLVTLLVVIGMLVLCGPLFAVQTFIYPSEEKALFTIDFPDDWRIDLKDGVLTAVPKDDSIYWRLSVSEGEKDMQKSIEEAGRFIDEWIEGYKQKKEKPEEVEINGIKFLNFEGAGKDIDKDSRTFGKQVDVDYFMFYPGKDVLGHIVSFASPEDWANHEKEMDAIIQSFKKADPKAEPKGEIKAK